MNISVDGKARNAAQDVVTVTLEHQKVRMRQVCARKLGRCGRDGSNGGSGRGGGGGSGSGNGSATDLFAWTEVKN